MMAREKSFYLTAKGLNGLKKEYKALKALRMAKTKEEVPKILESEDLNPEYLAFQEDLSFLESRLIEIENILKNAKLIRAPAKKNQNIINLGAKVFVEIDKTDKDQFEILGTLEADPNLGRISNESPVGRALLGHKIGDEVIVSSPIKTTYKVKKIKY